MKYKSITKNFSFDTFLKDVIAGLTTSLAALALGAAFGIQSGLGAVAGMIGAAIIPIITSILGGTRLQASGPTGPMTTVYLLAVSQAVSTFGNTDNKFYFLTLICILTGIIMILSGILKLGKFINLVPQLIIFGFMNGIALLIWRSEIFKIFGTTDNLNLFHTLLGIKQPIDKLSGNSLQNFILATVTVIIIFSVPYLVKKFNIPPKIRPFIPGTLVGILAATSFFLFANWQLQTVQISSSIQTPIDLLLAPTKFLPPLSFLTRQNILKALPFALQLALLGYLDSLLTSLVIDKITKEKSAQNKELMAQGLANMLAGIFGGIPGAQATIRSVILIKEGAKTRLAGAMVGIFTLIGIFLFKDMLGMVATAIFSGVLIKAGWDVLDKDFALVAIKNPSKYYKQAILVVLVTIVTVVIDLNVAVLGGSLLFFVLNKLNILQDFENVEDLKREL
jgi:SulP family sulfate permease